MAVDLTVATVDGASASSTAVTLQAFETANRLAAELQKKPAPYRVRVASPEGGSTTCGPGRFGLGTERLGRTRPDLIIVPGMSAATDAEVARLVARSDVAALGNWLAVQRGTIAASCSGVFVLAAAGVLEGKRATTTWWLVTSLAERYPGVRVECDAMVVQDGRITTAGASLAQLDLVLHLIARTAGPALADLVARHLVVEARASQARFVIPSFLATGAPELVAAERFIRRHLSEPFSIGDVAKAAGVSPRTFARRVTRATNASPVAFVRRIRVEVARHLISTTRASIEEVASRVGYGDSASLRRAFARLGERPSAARRQHSFMRQRPAPG
jgi:transcriptional regulator GlxA family with amidase domain